MKIAIDLTPIQSHHRFRGIGSVLVNFIKNLDDADKKTHTFVFFLDHRGEEEALSALDLSGVNYEVRHFRLIHHPQLPGRLNLLSRAYYKVRGISEYITGDPRISRAQLRDVDRFIQFDQNHKLPKRARHTTLLFLHDLIPLILEKEYLPSYRTARLMGKSFKGSIKCALRRAQYFYKIKINTRRARFLTANSEHTKADFSRLLHVRASKINVTYLGVDTAPDELTQAGAPKFSDYTSSMWGTVKRELNFGSKPFILYIGGTDPRRKMVDILAAFNNLRARGYDLSLVMAGDELEGVESLKNLDMKKYMKAHASYQNDIHLVGFIDDTQRDWLYGHALAFVFPSTYEGFGLPVLEAMAGGTPVITYKNSSITEVAQNDVIYASDFLDIVSSVALLADNSQRAAKLSRAGVRRASRYTWRHTTSTIINQLKSH